MDVSQKGEQQPKSKDTRVIVVRGCSIRGLKVGISYFFLWSVIGRLHTDPPQLIYNPSQAKNQQDALYAFSIFCLIQTIVIKEPAAHFCVIRLNCKESQKCLSVLKQWFFTLSVCLLICFL